MIGGKPNGKIMVLQEDDFEQDGTEPLRQTERWSVVSRRNALSRDMAGRSALPLGASSKITRRTAIGNEWHSTKNAIYMAATWRFDDTLPQIDHHCLMPLSSSVRCVYSAFRHLDRTKRNIDLNDIESREHVSALGPSLFLGSKGIQWEGAPKRRLNWPVPCCSPNALNQLLNRSR